MSRKVLSLKCVGHREQVRYLFSATLTDTPCAGITSRNSVGVVKSLGALPRGPGSLIRTQGDSALSPTATQTAVADAVTSVVDARRVPNKAENVISWTSYCFFVHSRTTIRRSVSLRPQQSPEICTVGGCPLTAITLGCIIHSDETSWRWGLF